MDNVILDATINMNPRVNSEAKKDFERNLFELKVEEGYKINKALLFRALVDQFNSDPEGTAEYLGIEK